MAADVRRERWNNRDTGGNQSKINEVALDGMRRKIESAMTVLLTIVIKSFAGRIYNESGLSTLNKDIKYVLHPADNHDVR